MITDILDNAHLYKHLHKNFVTAFDWLKTTNLLELEKGKYEIEGDQIFAIIDEYETKDKHECEVEAHRKHIDVQYMIKGTELFGYVPLQGQKPVVDYDEQNDFAIYKEETSFIKLEAGMFIIFYPTDLHQPEVRQFEPVTVKKAVIKIRID
ncbi:MAG: hypothetical protein JWQ96_1264 [Segetibacter sp.]|nr:hypothetical protein [Segetibacter sp.]